MKHYFAQLVVALSGTAFLPIQAADESKPAESPAGEAQKIVDMRLKMMKERLNLTPEQVEKVHAILLRDQEAFIKLRDDSSLTREARNTKAREILKSSTAELQALLTPEQKSLWLLEAEKQRKALLEKRAANQAPQPPEKK